MHSVWLVRRPRCRINFPRRRLQNMEIQLCRLLLDPAMGRLCSARVCRTIYVATIKYHNVCDSRTLATPSFSFAYHFTVCFPRFIDFLSSFYFRQTLATPFQRFNQTKSVTYTFFLSISLFLFLLMFRFWKSSFHHLARQSTKYIFSQF